MQVEHEVERESQTRYVGKGRGSAQRERQVIETIRCQIQAVGRDEEAIRAYIRNNIQRIDHIAQGLAHLGFSAEPPAMGKNGFR